MTFHTTEEVAMIIGCTPRTLYSACLKDHKVTLKEYMGRFKGMGVMSLRRKQFQSAMEGNTTMLRWLGIQHLGQSPRISILHKVPTSNDPAPAPAQGEPDPEGFEIDGLTDMDQDVPGSGTQNVGTNCGHNVTPGNNSAHALTHQGNSSGNDPSVVDAEIVTDED